MPLRHFGVVRFTYAIAARSDPRHSPLSGVFSMDRIQIFFVALMALGGVGFITMVGWLMLFGS